MYINIRTAYSWFYRHIAPTAFRDPQRNSSKCAQTAHGEVTLLQIMNKGLNDKVVCIDTAIYSYQLVIKNRERPCSLFFYLNNGVAPPPSRLSAAGVPAEVNLSARGQNEERENRKVRTPCSTSGVLLLISTYMGQSTAPQAECDFHEVNEAGDSVGRWQLDTIIFSF